MKLPVCVPKEFYNQISNLLSIFEALETDQKTSRFSAKILYDLLPESVKNSPVFFEHISKTWRYELESVYDRLPNGLVAVGTPLWPPVQRLYEGVLAAKVHLKSEDAQKIISFLAGKKHLDYLAELTPLAKLSDNTKAYYEVTEYGSGNRTLDWLFEPLSISNRRILLDIKHRQRDLINQMKQAAHNEVDEDSVLAQPIMDFDSLFKNTVEKFQPRLKQEILQGIWIHSYITLDEQELLTYFEGIDSGKLHFVIFNDGEKDATVLVRDSSDKDYLLNFFNLTETNRFLFSK
jgi:hypothetical protein